MSRTRLAACLLLLVFRVAPGFSAGAGIVGLVVDGAGKPVPGAEVELTRYSPEENRWPLPSPADQGLYRARTDAAGRFEVRDLPASWFDLRIEHPDFAPLKREGIVVEAGSGRVDLGRLALKTGRTVAGIVVDDKGLPLAGTEIWVREDARSAAQDRAFHDRGPRQVTGPDGRFSVPHLADEKEGLLLYACRPDRSQFKQDLDQPLPEPFQIVLPASRRLSGRVVDADGRPVPAAQVGAQRAGLVPSDILDVNDPCPQSDQNPSATTDAEGRFVLEPLAAGTFEVRATAAGFLDYHQIILEIGGEKGLRSFDVVLQRGIAVSGRVLGPGGEGIAGARVWFGRDQPEDEHPYSYDVHETRSREDGSFEILLVNGSYEVGALGPEGPDDAAGGLAEVRLPQPVVVADAPVDGIEIPMQRRLVLRGCVPGLLPDEAPSILITKGNIGRAPQTGPDGCYQVSDLSPGEWRINARLAGASPGAAGREIERRVTLSPDVPETRLDLDFSLGDRTLTIHPTGAGTSGDLYMNLLLPDGTNALNETIVPGQDGAFHISQLREGSYRIQISNTGKIRVDETVDLSTDREIVVEMP